jgi:hypothetical protein
MPRLSSSFGQQGTAFDYRSQSGGSLKGPSISSVVEPALVDGTTVAGTAPTATVTYNVGSYSILYLTTNAGANWTMNFVGTGGTPLNLFMTTGQVMTVALLATQGSTAYYNNAVQVDGTSVTPKWQGGTAPTAGNASAIDTYTYTIIKTGNAAFTVLASQTQFK